MTEQRDPEAILQDIDETRHELADTAAALAEKADVKARAHERVEQVKADAQARVDDAKSKVTDTAHQAATVPKRNPQITAVVLLLATGAIVGYYIVKRRG